MFKIGDLVKYWPAYGVPIERRLFGGDDKPWDQNDDLIVSTVFVNAGDICIVLDACPEKRRYIKGGMYIKILSPAGPGWIQKVYLHAV